VGGGHKKMIDLYSLFLVGSVISIFLGAFFTASEMALISSDKIYLKKLKERGIKSAVLALRHSENLDRLLTTTQFGSNLSITTATTLSTIYVSRSLESKFHFFILLIFPVILIFSDLLPKVIARHRADRVALFISYPLALFMQVFSPVIKGISFYINRLSNRLGIGKLDTLSKRRKMRDELNALLQDSDNESEIRLGHKRMIRRILEFSQQNVKKIMIPLVNVDAIEDSASVQDAIAIFESTRHSRLPIYEERIDNIIGILHFHDLFKSADLDESIKKYMTPALFVPEYQQLESLTADMKSQSASMAIAVDEYGGAVGVLTKEDILEEIVGNISDEYDDDTLNFLEMGPNTYLINVKIEINDLNERLKIKLPKGDYETLSGFLLQQFNRIPSVGDELYYGNLKFKVHRATEKAIHTVILNVFKNDDEEEK
jgi:putative hemolysin